MKKQDQSMEQSLKSNYYMMEELIKKNNVDFNTVKVKWDDSNLGVYSSEFKTKLSSKEVTNLELCLEKNWNEQENSRKMLISVWEHDPGSRGVSLVDFDPKRVESQGAAKSSVSKVQDVPLHEVTSSRPLSPVSPSEIRVR